MAQKRMFSKDVVRTDKFLDMSLSSQALYFHLSLDADVKGFVSPRLIMRMINSTADDLNVLITKGFVIPFESGVVVVTHWNVNNQIRETHEAPTQHLNEFKKLTALEQGFYQLQENYGSTTVELPHSIDKIRLDKIRLDKIKRERKNKLLIKRNFSKIEDITEPVIQELSEKYGVPVDFVRGKKEDLENYVASTGRKYKDYKATLNLWLKKDIEKLSNSPKHYAAGKTAYYTGP